jgi:Icc-related predicted phosphoesterase
MPAPEEIDAVIVAGDITNMGKPKGYRSGVSEDWEAAQKWMGQLSERYATTGYVLWVPGNHDIDVSSESFGSGLCLLDNCRVSGEVQPWFFRPRIVSAKWPTITGSSLCTAFDMPRLAETWAHTTAHRGEDLQHWQSVPPAEIVVSHCPPHGVLDSAGRLMERQEQEDGSMKMVFGPERHIGSPGLLEYIHRHKPRLVVCGHCHEARGQDRVGETLVVNTAERWQVVEV